MLSDFKLHFIGVADPTIQGQRPFRTPTLRQLGRNAPSMHNGSLRSLREVLVFCEAMEDAVGETLDGADSATQPRLGPPPKHLSLSPEEFPMIEASLAALDCGDAFPGAPARVPSGLPVVPSTCLRPLSFPLLLR
ncbi:MAG: hypothetical protein JNK85_12075 [Verrucomicrobiales bacterium]|nr:hypothetical protein [Verrucomicrobiales bacterium]